MLMRTSQNVYNQLRWDSRFDPSLYRLGYRTRQGKMREVGVVEFVPGGDVPWHRVHFIAGPQGVIWDRDTGYERIDPAPPPPTRAEAVGERLRFATWNCLLAGQSPRIEAILGWLEQLRADIVALQEVGQELLEALERSEWTVLGATPFTAGDPVMLSRVPADTVRKVKLARRKWAILARFGDFEVACVHLTSNRHGDAAAKRRLQWQAMRSQLTGSHWVVLGDFNGEVQRESGVRDVWSGPGHGFTFDPVRNRLARHHASSAPGRSDRILCSRGWQIRESQVWTDVLCSDHYPVVATLMPVPLDTVVPGWSRDSALAVLPPEELWPQIQSVRQTLDPGFARWMPHINVCFPFLERAPQLQETFSSEGPRVVHLEGLGYFPGRRPIWFWKLDHESQDWFRRLRARIEPGSHRSWTPHLTLARPGPVEWEHTASFTVDCLHWLRRDAEGVFRSHQRISLGS
jgi:poly(A) polymerase